jgi:putative SOS response-associated peptidase YedK
MLQWGLVPSWARDPAIGNKLMNAKAETLAEKPSFRTALRRRRCLVPADAYYEWQTGARGGARQPWAFRRRDGAPMGLAGLWEHWEGGDGSILETVTVVTVEANGVAARVHHRMPAILAPERFGEWLAPGERLAEAPQAALRPCPEEWIESYPVSPWVNAPGHDDARCLERVEPSGQQELF